MISWLLPLLVGATTGLGLVTLAAAWIPPRPDIADTIARLYTPSRRLAGGEPAETTTRAERLGAWVHQHTGRLPTRVTDADLDMLEITPAGLYARKTTYAALFCAAPATLGALCALAGVLPPATPALLGLLGAAGGWWLPDTQLTAQAAQRRQEFHRTVSAYYDLVTLDRLAGATTTDAITEAAEVATAPLFTRIRTAMIRARMERRAAWDGLAELADDINVPELATLAEMMWLSGERGSKVADNLRARARDIRNGFLNADIERAQVSLQKQVVAQVILLGAIFLFLLIPALSSLMS